MTLRWESLTGAQPAGATRISLEFADGSTKVVDVAGLLNGPVFKRIGSDTGAFEQLFFDDTLGAVCWPGDVDISPETLADLPPVR